ncbi:MAG: HAD-IA family hydrolase [Saprospiraceae bacterium]|nr:HAD-IA family hydrolase [Saprospiraceae bacterium]
MIRIQDKKVLTFDCYGTLIDWETGMLKTIRPILDNQRSTVTDEDILYHFGNIEHIIEGKFPNMIYSEVLKNVLTEISKILQFKVTIEEIDQFGSSNKQWLPFPDTVEALKKLSKYFKLVIVSNIDNESISETKKHLGAPFYRTYTAQEMKAYKPDIKVFNYVFDHLLPENIHKNEILHVAESLYHDHIPAAQLDLDSVWINRRFDKPGSGATPEVASKHIPLLSFNSLILFADWVEKNIRQPDTKRL